MGASASAAAKGLVLYGPSSLPQADPTALDPQSDRRPAAGHRCSSGPSRLAFDTSRAMRSRCCTAEGRRLPGVPRRRLRARPADRHRAEGLRRRDRRLARGGQALFRNCRLIGRRFRLAHIRFGYQIIEVATFRAAGAPSDGAEGARSRRRQPTRRPRQRELGTASDERERKTSTARTTSAAASCATTSTARSTRTCGGATSPAMPSTTTSRTSRSGTTSAASRTSGRARLRLIGDPETRYREDPVRMLRAVRFEAKLGFTIHESARTPFAPLAGLLEQHSAGAAARRIPEALPRGFRPAFVRPAARAWPARSPVPGDRRVPRGREGRHGARADPRGPREHGSAGAPRARASRRCSCSP